MHTVTQPCPITFQDQGIRAEEKQRIKNSKSNFEISIRKLYIEESTEFIDPKML